MGRQVQTAVLNMVKIGEWLEGGRELPRLPRAKMRTAQRHFVRVAALGVAGAR